GWRGRASCWAGTARGPAGAWAAQAQLLQHARRWPMAEGARLPLRRSRTLPAPAHSWPHRHAAFPRARGRRLRHAGADDAVGGGLRRRRARLFPPAQRAGGNAEISSAYGTGADRARRYPAGVDGATAPTNWRRESTIGRRGAKGAGSLLDPFEDAHVVRDRRTAHIEDTAKARIP